MNELSELEKKGKIGITVLMRVARRGAGLYLYIPKDLYAVYGLEGGQKLEVRLLNHYVPKIQRKKEVSKPF